MKPILLSLIALASLYAKAQTIDIDLSEKKGQFLNLELTNKYVRLTNCSKNFIYELDWKVTTTTVAPFDIKALSNNDDKVKACAKEVRELVTNLESENDEAKVKKFVEEGRKVMEKLGSDACAVLIKTSIDETERFKSIPFVLANNQVITLTITKKKKNGERDSDWSYTLKTQEKTRWLTHYGLSYAPQIINKTTKYYAKADETAANKYIITEQSNQDPKSWENISATINFTYPFSMKNRSLDVGWTAGFGLSSGLQLSGHTGISTIIGTNVILGTGVVIMQKYNLKGEYAKGQVIKENLTFESLHEKVWRPELYFTLGFRFNKNPFGGSSDKKEGTTDTQKPAPSGN